MPPTSPAPRLRLALLLACIAPGPLAAQVPPASFAALDSVVRASLERTGAPGASVAVVIDGTIAFARGYGVANLESGAPVTTETLFRVGSVTKMVTGALLAQLAESGRIDLAAPISRYVPELAGKRVGAVTTNQLLTHNAGWLDNAVAYGRMGEGALGEVMREVGDTLFLTEPGRVLSYSNPGYSMAGYVAEQAGGKRFATLAEEMVLRPAGMSLSTFRPLEAVTRSFAQGHEGPPGQPGRVVRPFTENTAQWAAGFLFSNATELARFAVMVMAGGMVEGQIVLAPGAVQRLTAGQVPMPGREAAGARYAYGLVESRRDGQRLLDHGGAINGFHANVVMVPERRFAVVVLTNRGGNPLAPVTEHALRTLAGLAPASSAAMTPRQPTAEERAALVGRYGHGPVQVTLSERDGGLILTQGPASLEVLIHGDRTIGFQPPGAPQPTRVVYVPGPDGRVAYLHQGGRALPRLP